MLTSLKRIPITKFLYKILFQIVSIFPQKKNLVVFESFLGKQYSCNPRAIYEYLMKHHPEFELIWSIDPRFEREFLESQIPYAKRFSIKWLFLMARARYWVTNSRMPLWIPKPKKTIYLQTWHGTPLKKLAHDMKEVLMPGTTTEKYKKEFYAESRNWDYLISPNRYSTDIFRRAFKFDKEIIETGYPRNDIFFSNNHNDINENFKKKYNLPQDKKVILYAPTWRDNQFHQVGKYKFDLHLDLKKIQKELGDSYIILLRMHYLVAENFDLGAYKGFAFDFSNYEDIRELYLISDILITDYSSVFFDFANLKRPVIFFVYDFEEYKEDIRGFYFNIEEKAPGPLVKTSEEVIEAIRSNVNNVSTSDKYKSFFNEFCYLETGDSTKRVVEKVFLGK